MKHGSDAIAAYVAEIARIHSAGMATEHSCRSAIMKLAVVFRALDLTAELMSEIDVAPTTPPTN